MNDRSRPSGTASETPTKKSESTVPRGTDVSREVEAARLVWLVRRRGLKPLPGITHSAWIASVACWLRGTKRAA
jgi:hypothetical protein